MLQFRQQPALFQGAVAIDCSKRLTQYKCLGFGHLPDRGPYRVTSQLPERANSLVTVDHHVSSRLFRHRHYHNRYLLARYR